MTPLGLAIIGGNADLVRFMIAHDADIRRGSRNPPALTVAVTHERYKIVELLLDENAELEAVDDHQRTALLWAIWKKNERLVALLLTRGANADVTDKKGKTAEFWAKWTKNKMIVFLIAHPLSLPQSAPYLGDSLYSNTGDKEFYE